MGSGCPGFKSKLCHFHLNSCVTLEKYFMCPSLSSPVYKMGLIIVPADRIAKTI